MGEKLFIIENVIENPASQPQSAQPLQSSVQLPPGEATSPPTVIPMQKSSQNKLFIAGIVLVLVLLAGGYILLKILNKPDIIPSSSGTVNNTILNNAQQPTPTIGTSLTIQPTAKVSLSGDQLDQENQAIDNDLNFLDSDAANVDQGLNDQQIDVGQ